MKNNTSKKNNKAKLEKILMKKFNKEKLLYKFKIANCLHENTINSKSKKELNKYFIYLTNKNIYIVSCDSEYNYTSHKSINIKNLCFKVSKNQDNYEFSLYENDILIYKGEAMKITFYTAMRYLIEYGADIELSKEDNTLVLHHIAAR